MSDRDDVLTVSLEDYEADVGKYVDLSSGDTMVQVMAGDETIMVMGRGKPEPMTDEQRRQLARETTLFFEELNRVPLPLIRVDYARWVPAPITNTWFD